VWDFVGDVRPGYPQHHHVLSGGTGCRSKWGGLRDPPALHGQYFPNMLSAMCRSRVLFCKITPLREFSFTLILTFRYYSKKWVFIDTGKMPRFWNYRRVGSNTVALRNKITTRQHRTFINTNIRILAKIKDSQWFIEEVYIQDTVCRNCWENLVINATMYFLPISSLLPATF